MADPLLGTAFGNYRLVKRLGSGGMGTVYLGHNPTSKRDVAVKILRPASAPAHEQQFRERFLREIQVTVRIHHPHVVQVLDAGVHHRMLYLVMELVPGGSLGDRLDRQGPIDADTLLPIASQLAEGLAAIHRLGVVHRDIKPDNVLLGSDHTVKISDLGLARHTDDEQYKRLTVSGMVVGTPYYLAPEAIRDCRNAGPPADIYSFGASLYHCLTGIPPFDAPSAYEVMRMHLEDRYRPLRQFDRRLPRHLCDLINCCLDKDPERRPDAEDCITALRQGGRLRHEQHGMGFVAAILVALIGLIATITWQTIGAETIDHRFDRATVSRNASIRLPARTPEPGLRLRINDGDWQDWRAGSWHLSPGRNRIEVISHRDGERYAWTHDAELRADQEIELTPVLRPVALDMPYPISVPIALPEGHMLFHRGENRGRRQELHFNTAGRWVIAHWNGSEAGWRHLQVHPDGSSELGPWQAAHVPPAEAYLKRWHRDRPTIPHHIVSWWECERIRGSLPVPPAWVRQISQPEQPALGLDHNPALIEALEAWRSPHGLRLPDADEARTLARLYDTGIWYHGPHGPRVAGGGNPGRALLVLVAAEQKTE